MAGTPGIQMAASFSTLTDLDPVLTEIFYQHLGEPDPMLDVFFRVLNSTKAKETDQRVGSFGQPEEWKGQVSYDGADPDYDITFTHTKYSRGFKVERELLDDMQYNKIFSRAEEMAGKFGVKIETDAASVFNNAFSSSYTGYDAKALCADDHPRSESDSTSVDNKAALSLTPANLDTVRIQGEALVDDRGDLIGWSGDLLLVPSALKKTAHEITQSELLANSAENNANFFRGLQYKAWNRLTDTNAWFLIDSRMMKRYLKWYWRRRPDFKATEDFDTELRKYAGFMRYSYGWSDFRWLVGSNPS
jgi:phage major head subunit gpT-like protein